MPKRGAEEAPDWWFDWSLMPNLKAVVVYQAMKDAVDASRKRAPKKHDHLWKTYVALFANVARHYLARTSAKGIAVPRGKRFLARVTRYEPQVFPSSFPIILDRMEHLGFLKQTKGTYSGLRQRSRRTVISAGPALIKMIDEAGLKLTDISSPRPVELIVLNSAPKDHWDEPVRVDYKDTPTTRKYRKELQEINEWLVGADIAFSPPEGFETPVDVSQRRMTRRFSQGSFQCGGRLYGAFWETLRKDARRTGLRIEGERIAEVDYKAMNPMLAYHHVRAVPPEGDPYELPGFPKDRETRAAIKELMNAQFFRPLSNRYPKEFDRPAFKKKWKFSQVVEAILARHPLLRGVLSSGVIGHTLQFWESQLLIRVLKRCKQVNIVALPLHDSVIVRASASREVREIMETEFEKFAGFPIGVTIEGHR